MTDNQHKFADYYIETGNATESYKRAYPGCKTQRAAQSNGNRLLRKAEVRSYIAERNAQIASERVADMQEINEFWTSIMRDGDYDLKDRIKVSELRAKTLGAFLDRRQDVASEVQTGIVLLPDVKGGDPSKSVPPFVKV